VVRLVLCNSEVCLELEKNIMYRCPNPDKPEIMGRKRVYRKEN